MIKRIKRLDKKIEKRGCITAPFSYIHIRKEMKNSFCKINLYNGGMYYMPYDKAEQEQNSNDKSPMIDPFV